MSARLLRGALLATLLAAARARAADVTFVAVTQTTSASSRTMRIPRSGTFSVPSLASGYLIVAVGNNNIDYDVDTVTWEVTNARGITTSVQAFYLTSIRAVTTPETCRTELWALANPVAGTGFVTVTVKGSSSPIPSMAGSLYAFANVASLSTNGPCCVGATNSGSGTSTINKTFLDTSRGDALVNAVCTSYTNPAVPGMPGPDPANDPEMVPRTFQTISNLQHFTGTSPGGEADAPATKYRHLRWLQTGSRSWAIAGLSLHATSTAALPIDAGAPTPDAAPPPRDTAAPVDAAPGPAADTAPTLPGDEAPAPADAATSLPDATPPEDSTPAVPGLDGSLAFPSRDVEAGTFEPEADADFAQRQVSFQVGCACRLGAPGGGGGSLAIVLIALWFVRRRDDSRRLP